MAAIGIGNIRQAARVNELGGRFDPWILGVAVTLASVGVVMVGSAAIAGGGVDAGPWYFLSRHLLALAIGLGLAVAAMCCELKELEKYNQKLLLACALLLALVWVPVLGKSVNGAQRWITLGVFNFQVVEAVKLLYIVWLASYLKRYSEDVAVTLGALMKPVGVVSLLVVLLLLQPDFGSSVLLICITAGMLLLGGAPIKRLIAPGVLLTPVLIALIVFEPYRMRRVTSFMDPWQDQLGAGYQLSNALMAIGRGEWFGVGLGASIQKLNYLPEAHTDFIFSVLAEELGFAGVTVIVGLYALLAGRSFWLGMRCVEMRRHFSGYIAFGIALWMGLQSCVSMGVNLGLLPTKGLTLPMISSGGSSVMMSCAALGLLLRVSWEYERARRQVAKHRPVSEVTAASPTASVAVPPVNHVPANRSSRHQRVEPVMGQARPESAALAALRRAR